MHAVDPVQIKANAKWMGAGEISVRVEKLGSADKSARWVTLSGGDPLMWELGDTVAGLQEIDYKVAVETQGAFWKDWLLLTDLITVSPKPPSSGMQGLIDYVILDRYASSIHGAFKNVSFKVVIKDSDDFEWACMLHDKYPEVPFYLSCWTDTEVRHNIASEILAQYTRLVNLVLSSNRSGDFIVLPQLHAMLWGHEKAR
jgi:7-carboxy-7-deazaguanine synthase